MRRQGAICYPSRPVAPGFPPRAPPGRETEDEPGVLARVTEAIAKGDTNIRQIEAESVEPNRGRVRVLVEVKSRRHLEKLEQGIQAVSGVREVGRTMGGGGGRREE